MLRKEQFVPQPILVVFEFFSRPDNLQILTPPWLDFHITKAPAKLEAGSMIQYRLRLHKVSLRWKTEITDWQPPHQFVDLQIAGPYALWRHEHTFRAREGGTLMEDTVQYSIPLGLAGRAAHKIFVRRDIEKIFEYRAQKMRDLFA